MSKPIEYSIIFARKKTNSKKSLIEIRAYQDRKRKYFSTGIKVDPSNWDKLNRKVKRNHPDHIILNMRIEDQLKELKEYEQEIYRATRKFTLQDFNNRFIPGGGFKKVDFTSFMESMIQKLTNERAESTIKGYRVTLSKLKKWKDQIEFDSISTDFYRDFDAFLSAEYNNSPNRRKTDNKVLKTFINMAIKRGHIPSGRTPEDLGLKWTNTGKVYLTNEELLKLWSLEYPHFSTKDDVRDLFLLSCWLGIRISDLKKITKSDFEYNSNDGLFFHRISSKVDKQISIPLRYVFNPNHRKGEKSIGEIIALKHINRTNPRPSVIDKTGQKFLKFSETHYRRTLKEVLFDAGIEKKISSHAGRHTFGTLLTINGINNSVLQQMLQHSDPRTTLIYQQLGAKGFIEALKAIS